MNSQTGLVVRIQSRIARRTERIARWDKEADQIEPLWSGGSEYRRFCEQMAGAAREKKAALEAELTQLQGVPGVAAAAAELADLQGKKKGIHSLPIVEPLSEPVPVEAPAAD